MVEHRKEPRIQNKKAQVSEPWKEIELLQRIPFPWAILSIQHLLQIRKVALIFVIYPRIIKSNRANEVFK